MRPSILPRYQRLYNPFEAASRRSISSIGNRAQSPRLCSPCRTSRDLQAIKPQRRWQSSAAISTPHADDTIRSNPIPATLYEFFPQALSSGPPPSGPFQVDPRSLRKEYLQLQAKAHPDRHPASLKNRAEATSARINEAYKTLQNPLLRAQYLLSLRGIDVAEDETAKTEDPELLMQVLDTREEVENAQEEGDLDGLKKENDERIAMSEEVLNEAFRVDDMERAKSEAVRLRYWVNIKESLDNWEKGKPVVLVH